MLLTLLLLFSLCNAISGQNNPYYVDKSSVIESDHKLTMKLKNHHTNSFTPASSFTANNPEIKVASITFESLDKRVLRFKMTDAEAARWEAPIYNPDKYKHYKPKLIKNMGIKYNYDPFTFEIRDPMFNIPLMSSSNSSLKFFDKYIEFGMRFPSQKIFGMGERVTPDFELCIGRTECIYTTFSRGATSPLDKGIPPGGFNMYGHQPFYLIQLPITNLFMGILFLNSNAQDTRIEKISNGDSEIEHRPVGGIIDYYIFYPNTSEEVLRKYHALIGRPYIPPFWSLGFHQCKWGWSSLSIVKSVVSKFDQNDIPLDAIWSDIDYMKDYADFSIDPVKFAGMGEFVENMHRKQIKWMPIIDAGIKYSPEDPYYVEGEKMNAFIKSAFKKKTLVGKVWPGPAVFLDWFNPNSTLLWHKGLGDLQKKAAFDGIWLDMNECANFCDGECDPKEEIGDHVSEFGDPHDPHEFDNLPYLPGNRTLIHRAMSMSAYHLSKNEFEDKFYKQYNLHSLWAVDEAKATHSYFTDKLKKRPFIITRANFVGSGMYTSKWLGDNHSKWEDLRYSITGVYNSQLYGIPLNGADICGFGGDTNEELCLRWMQLGSFYPFSRNHNTRKGKSQEPYIWKSVTKASRNAIRQKYSILRYYYTKLFEVSLNGGSVVRPLFFDYPADQKAYDKKNETFLIGSSILVAPVVYKGVKQVKPYLTNENWYDLFKRKSVFKYNPKEKEGKIVTLDAGYEYVNVLLKGGSIIPFQNALKRKVRRAKTLDVLETEIIIALDKNGIAQGNLIIDDDTIINPLVNDNYKQIKFHFIAGERKLRVYANGNHKTSELFARFSKLSIWGAERLGAIKSAIIKDKNDKILKIPATYDKINQILTIEQKTGWLWEDIVTIDLK